MRMDWRDKVSGTTHVQEHLFVRQTRGMVDLQSLDDFAKLAHLERVMCASAGKLRGRKRFAKRREERELRERR